jgi:cell cycle sensor histidine kinase DivJ
VFATDRIERLAGVSLAGLVDPPVGEFDAPVRHQVFIAIHVAIAVLGCACLPLLLLGGVPSLGVSVVFSGVLLPILAGLYLAKGGDLGSAHLISATGFALWLAIIIAITGQTAALLPFLALIPVQAALSGSSRVVALSLLPVAGVAAILYLSMHTQAEPDAIVSIAALLAAAAYGALLGIGMAYIQARTNRARGEAESQARTIAAAMPDLVTIQDRSGRLTFASSPAAERLLGASSRELLGPGFAERVQVADRPAFLNAVAAAWAGTAPSPVELRLARAAEGTSVYKPCEMRCEQIDGAVVCSFRDIQDSEAGSPAEQDPTAQEARPRTRFVFDDSVTTVAKRA